MLSTLICDSKWLSHIQNDSEATTLCGVIKMKSGCWFFWLNTILLSKPAHVKSTFSHDPIQSSENPSTPLVHPEVRSCNAQRKFFKTEALHLRRYRPQLVC